MSQETLAHAGRVENTANGEGMVSTQTLRLRNFGRISLTAVIGRSTRRLGTRLKTTQTQPSYLARRVLRLLARTTQAFSRQVLTV